MARGGVGIASRRSSSADVAHPFVFVSGMTGEGLAVQSTMPTTGGERELALAAVHAELVLLSKQVAAFELRSLECQQPEELERALTACVRIAEASIRVFEEVARLAPELGESEQDVDGATEGEPATCIEPLRQVASLARMEVQRVLQRVSARATMAPDYLVHHGSSLHRKVARGVYVVEQTVARARNSASQVELGSGPAASLRVRKIYAWFRRSIDTGTQLRRDNVQKVLRTIGTRIATLIGKDEYGELRPDDRVLFMKMQKRILTWLATQPPTFEEGRRLFEDCRAMADILRQVNLRSDLIAHDAALARAVAVEVAKLGDVDEVNGSLYERLLPLEGLDDELDAYFARRERPPANTVKRVLSRADAAARSRGV